MSINQKIQNIVDLRAEHLPKIEDELDNLNKLEKALGDLDTLRAEVKSELDSGQGVYYSMLMENPKMHQAYNKVDTERVRELLESQRSKLENLKKRFSRKTVCIAMIGYERQGKSTFLQAISGLNNKVIPAYGGTSCTGAVSVIHNIEGPFHVDVTYYTVSEFLGIIKHKLNKFFPGRNFSINTPQDLLNVDLSGFSTTDKDLNGEFVKFKEAYKDHANDYWDLLGKGTVSYSDENDVIQHVAQYEEFDEEVPGSTRKADNDDKVVYVKKYYKYLAVKNVHIYKTFEMIDSKLIELVDTIGMGTYSENEKIKEEMFNVLREDCDAAVNLFKPATEGGLNNNQTTVLQALADKLVDRNPSKWIYYVINKVRSGRGKNEPNIPTIEKEVNDFLSNMTVKPVAGVKVVDGNDPTEVRTLLVEPLLMLITDNLPTLDALIMEDANATGESLRSAYYQLVNNVEAVISGSLMRGASEGKMFDDLYGRLGLSSALRKLDEENYGVRKNRPCNQIEKAISTEIDNLYDVIPDAAKIEKAIDEGAKSPAGIYADSCDYMRTQIVRKFDSVSDHVISPLREDAKKEVAKVLFEYGRMGNIPLKGYAVKDGSSLTWLRCLVEEKVKADAYPRLRKILLYVLDYDFTIKYNIEYDVTSRLGLIDQLNHKDFQPFIVPASFDTVTEKTNAIIKQLMNKIPDLQEKLREGNNQFSLIPSHSFWAMINNFRTDVVRGEDTKRDLREFYRDNAWSVWKDDFNSIVDKQQAFGRWNEVANNLSGLYSSTEFTIKQQ